MELLLGDCLELMPEIKDNSVDLLFCDLPYGQTSCKWDSLIDLEKFWKEVNRVCKIDTPMLFTCSVKFGNTLINSNTKNFRYDLVWVKSAAVGFLNSKKMPLRKSEMIYVFYRKLSKVYTENISLHHTHKFIKETENVIKEGTHGNAYNTENRNKPIIRSKANQYDPPLPNSVIKNEENIKYDCECDSELYGDVKRGEYKERKDRKTIYNPPLPNSVIKDEVYNQLETGHNPNNLTAEQKKTNIYEPALPNSLLECKSEKGKHSTQKPVSLMEWILKYYSREGGLVLDPTMGSGSMGVACKNMNRNFIGIEKDEKIFQVAMERIND